MKLELELIITAEDGVQEKIDISDKKYINLNEMRQKAEISYLKRKLQQEVKK